MGFSAGKISASIPRTDHLHGPQRIRGFVASHKNLNSEIWDPENLESQRSFKKYKEVFKVEFKTELILEIPPQLRRRHIRRIRGYNPDYDAKNPELGKYDVINNRLKTAVAENNHSAQNILFNLP